MDNMTAKMSCFARAYHKGSYTNIRLAYERTLQYIEDNGVAYRNPDSS